MTDPELIKSGKRLLHAQYISPRDKDAIAALIARIERDQWRPINEAARDGQEWLCGWFYPDNTCKVGTQCVAHYELGGWCVGPWDCNVLPTHYRLLPTSPDDVT